MKISIEMIDLVNDWYRINRVKLSISWNFLSDHEFVLMKINKSGWSRIAFRACDIMRQWCFSPTGIRVCSRANRCRGWWWRGGNAWVRDQMKDRDNWSWFRNKLHGLIWIMVVITVLVGLVVHQLGKVKHTVQNYSDSVAQQQ